MADHKTLRLDDQLCFALYAATNAVTRAYRPLLADLDLTYPQYLVMLVLWQDGRSTSRAIADRLHLSANAISPLLERLERGGLILRQRDQADRRVVHIDLTEHGRALQSLAYDAQQAVECRTGLALDELERLRDELVALAMRMGGNAVSCP
ncbi:MarR family transcriptional regulator [Aurantimonas sp. 22II-16-19i]|uniref:MarR family winged helix-turn-helix transcriptional regulator n=1 Tax=Aurantimonas sp. 22II-16-19i TaxID=1317114 RepID=UPI0009F7D63D|nr:MarR family transcriptional regulator [Aurantimonas sp. 22II-16-19i]ORE98589.1 transcriptional regulator TrmB [Aurantimonas sp. 22II-16-19i]